VRTARVREACFVDAHPAGPRAAAWWLVARTPGSAGAASSASDTVAFGARRRGKREAQAP